MPTKTAPHQCPRCNVPLVRRTNPVGGGVFWGCSTWADTGCRVYWSPEHGLRNPHVEVSRASSRRSPVTSMRARAIDEVSRAFQCSREEATDLVDRDGCNVMELLMI